MRKWLIPGILVLAACGSSTGGTLQPVMEEGGDTVGFANFAAGSVKSFGVFVCTDGPVELTTIEALSIEGEIELLGADVYVSDEKFVGAANGFPTDGLEDDKLESAVGAVVDIPCSQPEGSERVQIIFGAERLGSGGGVIEGIEIETDAGTVEIPLTILLCGDELEYCEVLDDSSA